MRSSLVVNGLDITFNREPWIISEDVLETFPLSYGFCSSPANRALQNSYKGFSFSGYQQIFFVNQFKFNTEITSRRSWDRVFLSWHEPRSYRVRKQRVFEDCLCVLHLWSILVLNLRFDYFIQMCIHALCMCRWLKYRRGRAQTAHRIPRVRWRRATGPRQLPASRQPSPPYRLDSCLSIRYQPYLLLQEWLGAYGSDVRFVFYCFSIVLKFSTFY